MAKLSNRLLGFLRQRTFIEKILLVLVIQQVAYEAFDRLAGVALPLDGLLKLLFFTLAFLIAIKYLFRLFRRTVWRLRNRLILAYVFIGVVPITLILVMLGLGMYILMGQVATYLMTAELNRRNEVVRDCAYALAWNVADHLGRTRVNPPQISSFSLCADAWQACRPSCVWTARPFKSQETPVCLNSLDGASTVSLGL